MNHEAILSTWVIESGEWDVFVLKTLRTEHRIQHTYSLTHNCLHLKADFKCQLSFISTNVCVWFIQQVKNPVKWLIERWESESNLSPLCLECTLVMRIVFRLGWTGINLSTPHSVSLLDKNVWLTRLPFPSLCSVPAVLWMGEFVSLLATLWCTITNNSWWLHFTLRKHQHWMVSGGRWGTWSREKNGKLEKNNSI